MFKNHENFVNLVSLTCFGKIQRPNSRQMVHNSCKFLLISTPDIELTQLLRKQAHTLAKSTNFYKAMVMSTQ